MRHTYFSFTWRTYFPPRLRNYIVQSLLPATRAIQECMCLARIYFGGSAGKGPQANLELFHGWLRVLYHCIILNPLNAELNPICHLLALLGAHHFLHVSRIKVKLLTFRLLMSYIYGAPILDVSRSHTTTQHSR